MEKAIPLIQQEIERQRTVLNSPESLPLPHDHELEARFRRDDRERAEDVLRRIRKRQGEIDQELAATRTVRTGPFGLRRYAVWGVNGDRRRQLERVQKLLRTETKRRKADVARLAEHAG
jgi:hypothetical protein